MPQASHIASGGIPATLIAGVVAVLTAHHVNLTTEEAVFYGGIAAAFGVAVSGRIQRYGLKGIFTGLWKGSQTITTEITVPPTSTPLPQSDTPTP